MKPKLMIITAMTLFGSIGLFVRAIDLSSGAIALYRGFLGGVFLLLVSLALKRKFDWQSIRRNFLILAASGAAIGFNWIFLFQAYKYTSIANATLSYYFAPVFVVLLSPFILKERLSLLRFCTVAAAVVGLFLVVGFDAEPGRELFIGIGYGLLAAALYSSVMILNKFIKNLNGLDSTLL
ncbi:MAG: DMT family transporter, partial [Bacillota bacterium]|nr:DMT family transporter [Bacillota bacterium]